MLKRTLILPALFSTALESGLALGNALAAPRAALPIVVMGETHGGASVEVLAPPAEAVEASPPPATTWTAIEPGHWTPAPKPAPTPAHRAWTCAPRGLRASATTPPRPAYGHVQACEWVSP